MNKTLMTVLGVIVLIGIFLFGRFNGLVSADEGVTEAWAEVENQYQRRLDLIENLVNTVKGFADQELEVFTQVVEARAEATKTDINIDDAQQFAQFQKSQGELSSAISRLLVTVEAYPELKSDQNFLALQAEIEGTENRIATARTRFNAAVRKLNTLVRSFPSNIVASVFGFERKSSFSAEAGAENAPKVDFSGRFEDKDDAPEIDELAPVVDAEELIEEVKEEAKEEAKDIDDVQPVNGEDAQEVVPDGMDVDVEAELEAEGEVAAGSDTPGAADAEEVDAALEQVEAILEEVIVE